MSVFLTKAGLFSETWNGNKRKYIRRRVKKIAVWRHLRDACEIEQGVTLLDILRTVGQYKMLKIFLAEYSWCGAIDEFHAQAEEPDLSGVEENPDEAMTHLEIYWHADYTNYDKKEPASIGIEPAFHGRGPARGEHAEHGDSEGMMSWGIDFSPVYKLADLPVKLDKSVEFYTPGDYKPGRKPLVKGERYFSLQDVLDAIYWEISFHGSPQSKSEKLDELRTTVEGIKDGTIKTFPMELPDDQNEVD